MLFIQKFSDYLISFTHHNMFEAILKTSVSICGCWERSLAVLPEESMTGCLAPAFIFSIQVNWCRIRIHTISSVLGFNKNLLLLLLLLVFLLLLLFLLSLLLLLLLLLLLFLLFLLFLLLLFLLLYFSFLCMSSVRTNFLISLLFLLFH